MIVQCRSCTMRYHLDDSVLGSKGCQVRCTSCGNIWHQSPAVAKNMLVARVEEKEIKDISFSRGTKIIIFSIALFISSAGSFYMGQKSLNSFGPWVDGWIELSGGKEHKPSLELIAFSFDRTKEGTFLCQGSLHNSTNQTIISPKIVLIVDELNEQGKKIVHKKEYVLKDIDISAGQTQTFSFSILALKCNTITATIR